jgi:hypothetical protein
MNEPEEDNVDVQGQEFVCETCGRRYTVLVDEINHLFPSDEYELNCSRYCRACWLGVGPKDFPESQDQQAT